MKTIAQKMGIKKSARAYFINAPQDIISAINLPDIDLSDKLSGNFDYIHLFVKKQSEQESVFPKLKAHLESGVCFGYPGQKAVNWRPTYPCTRSVS